MYSIKQTKFKGKNHTHKQTTYKLIYLQIKQIQNCKKTGNEATKIHHSKKHITPWKVRGKTTVISMQQIISKGDHVSIAYHASTVATKLNCEVRIYTC